MSSQRKQRKDQLCKQAAALGLATELAKRLSLQALINTVERLKHPRAPLLGKYIERKGLEYHGGYVCVQCGRTQTRAEFRNDADNRFICINGVYRCHDCQPKSIPKDYDRRNMHVMLLGFNCYSDYLEAEMWQIIRSRVLHRDNSRCVVCGERAIDVHHNSYEVDVLVGKDLTQLVSLCRRHHREAEFDSRHGKRTLEGVRQTLSAQGLAVPPLERQEVPECLRPISWQHAKTLEREERQRREKQRRAWLHRAWRKQTQSSGRETGSRVGTKLGHSGHSW